LEEKVESGVVQAGRLTREGNLQATLLKEREREELKYSHD